MKCPRCGEKVSVLYSGVEEVVVIGDPHPGDFRMERRRVTMCGKCCEEYDTLPSDTPLTQRPFSSIDALLAEYKYELLPYDTPLTPEDTPPSDLLSFRA